MIKVREKKIVKIVKINKNILCVISLLHTKIKTQKDEIFYICAFI